MSNHHETWRARVAVEQARARGESAERICTDLGVSAEFVADVLARMDELNGVDE